MRRILLLLAFVVGASPLAAQTGLSPLAATQLVAAWRARNDHNAPGQGFACLYAHREPGHALIDSVGPTMADSIHGPQTCPDATGLARYVDEKDPRDFQGMASVLRTRPTWLIVAEVYAVLKMDSVRTGVSAAPLALYVIRPPPPTP